MYRSFPQMWEGWTKNLALLFPAPQRLAFWRLAEFLAIGASSAVSLNYLLEEKWSRGMTAGVLAALLTASFQRRIRRAHFDWLSNTLAVFGLPLFAILLMNSDISYKRGAVRWKGRSYDTGVIPRTCNVAQPGAEPRYES